MAALLSKAGKDLTVTVLLDALQQTKDFELSLAKKFGASVGFISFVGEEFILTNLQATRHPPSDVADTSSTFAVNQFLFRATHGGICTAPRQVSFSSASWGSAYLTHSQSYR